MRDYVCPDFVFNLGEISLYNYVIEKRDQFESRFDTSHIPSLAHLPQSPSPKTEIIIADDLKDLKVECYKNVVKLMLMNGLRYTYFDSVNPVLEITRTTLRYPVCYCMHTERDAICFMFYAKGNGRAPENYYKVQERDGLCYAHSMHMCNANVRESVPYIINEQAGAVNFKKGSLALIHSYVIPITLSAVLPEMEDMPIIGKYDIETERTKDMVKFGIRNTFYDN